MDGVKMNEETEESLDYGARMLRDIWKAAEDAGVAPGKLGESRTQCIIDHFRKLRDSKIERQVERL